MEHILPSSILNGIYSYYKYYDLLKYKNIPDCIWKTMYDYFCKDSFFRHQMHNFWGNVISTSRIVSYKYQIVQFIEYLVKYGDCFPIYLLNYRDFIYDCVERNVYHDIIMKSNYSSDFELMLRAVDRNVKILTVTSLRRNRNFMLEAVKRNIISVVYLTPILWQDREIICAVADQLGIVVDHDLIGAYKQCLIYIIANNPILFYDLDNEFRDDASNRLFMFSNTFCNDALLALSCLLIAIK